VKIYQVPRTVFHHIFKHLDVRQKYSATRRICNSLLGVWKCGQTRSFMFDILLQNQFIFKTKIRDGYGLWVFKIFRKSFVIFRFFFF